MPCVPQLSDADVSRFLIRPGHFLPLLCGTVLMITCPLLTLSPVDKGQHGHPDWSAATRGVEINQIIDAS